MTNEMRAALWTALFTFLGGLSLSVATWLAGLHEWAQTSGTSEFPDISVLGYATVSAVVAAAGGLINWVVRVAQTRGVLPGRGPAYPPSDGSLSHDVR